MNQPALPAEFEFDPAHWILREIGEIADRQTDLPRIAKDSKLTAGILVSRLQVRP
ncbi:MAG: hypothetical protein ACREF9_11130 [Opitutaceae bacterium]